MARISSLVQSITSSGTGSRLGLQFETWNISHCAYLSLIQQLLVSPKIQMSLLHHVPGFQPPQMGRNIDDFFFHFVACRVSSDTMINHPQWGGIQVTLAGRKELFLRTLPTSDTGFGEIKLKILFLKYDSIHVFFFPANILVLRLHWTFFSFRFLHLKLSFILFSFSFY